MESIKEKKNTLLLCRPSQISVHFIEVLLVHIALIILWCGTTMLNVFPDSNLCKSSMRIVLECQKYSRLHKHPESFPAHLSHSHQVIQLHKHSYYVIYGDGKLNFTVKKENFPLHFQTQYDDDCNAMVTMITIKIMIGVSR